MTQLMIVPQHSQHGSSWRVQQVAPSGLLGDLAGLPRYGWTQPSDQSPTPVRYRCDPHGADEQGDGGADGYAAELGYAHTPADAERSVLADVRSRWPGEWRLAEIPGHDSRHWVGEVADARPIHMV